MVSKLPEELGLIEFARTYMRTLIKTSREQQQQTRTYDDACLL
jgi:hypothetical protein